MILEQVMSLIRVSLKQDVKKRRNQLNPKLIFKFKFQKSFALSDNGSKDSDTRSGETFIWQRRKI